MSSSATSIPSPTRPPKACRRETIIVQVDGAPAQTAQAAAEMLNQAKKMGKSAVLLQVKSGDDMRTIARSLLHARLAAKSVATSQHDQAPDRYLPPRLALGRCQLAPFVSARGAFFACGQQHQNISAGFRQQDYIRPAADMSCLPHEPEQGESK